MPIGEPDAVVAGLWSGEKREDEQDVTQLSFTNSEFLRAYGLNSRNILDYFYSSPFYARCGGPTSLNEAWRRSGCSASMQGEKQRHELDGHEFVLASCNEDARQGRIETSVFVVQKVLHRRGQEGTDARDVFYVISGTIYKAPQLGAVFDGVLQVVSFATERILAKQVEDLDRKRRKLVDERTSVTASSAHGGAESSPGGETPVEEDWPAWCVFPRKTVPSHWVRQAMAAASAASSGNDATVMSAAAAVT